MALEWLNKFEDVVEAIYEQGWDDGYSEGYEEATIETEDWGGETMTVYVLESGDFDLYHKHHYFNTYEEAFEAVQIEVEGSGRYTAQEAIDGGLIGIKEIKGK